MLLVVVGGRCWCDCCGGCCVGCCCRGCCCSCYGLDMHNEGQLPQLLSWRLFYSYQLPQLLSLLLKLQSLPKLSHAVLGDKGGCGVGVRDKSGEDTTMSPVIMLRQESNDEPWSVKHAEKQSTRASTEIHDSAIATTYETLSEAVDLQTTTVTTWSIAALVTRVRNPKNAFS